MLAYLLIAIVSILFLLIYRWRIKKTATTKRPRKLKTLICIGSGGHTSEMLRILANMDVKQYEPRLYVAASDDTTSEVKILHHEQSNGPGSYSIEKIYRSRKVGQSYMTSVLTTLYSIISCIPIVIRFDPDVYFCNGPGTCIPICLIIIFMRILSLSSCKIVFIESICRVQTLSLSGKILLHLADVFVVQWKSLAESNKKMLYFGRLS